MTFDRKRRTGGHFVAALMVAGLMTSTAGRAVTPLEAQERIVPVEVEQAIASWNQAEALEKAETPEEAVKHVGDGEASYYGKELAGNRTASGERFNPSALTAAHRTLPLGSKLRVTNKGNGKSVIVRVNDRGPFAKNRLIDVSFAAAKEINMVRAGTAKVRLELLS